MTHGTISLEDRAMRAACTIERALCAFACENSEKHQPCGRCSAGYFQEGEREEVARIVATELRNVGEAFDR